MDMFLSGTTTGTSTQTSYDNSTSGLSATTTQGAIDELKSISDLKQDILAEGEFVDGDKSKLDGIEANANNFTLSIASATELGGIKIGSGLSIDGSGVLSADAQTITLDSTITAGSTNAVEGGAIYSALQTKQDTLTSGVNIKTVNGNPILGSGDIVISGGASTLNALSDVDTTGANVDTATYGLRWDAPNNRYTLFEVLEPIEPPSISGTPTNIRTTYGEYQVAIFKQSGTLYTGSYTDFDIFCVAGGGAGGYYGGGGAGGGVLVQTGENRDIGYTQFKVNVSGLKKKTTYNVIVHSGGVSAHVGGNGNPIGSSAEETKVVYEGTNYIVSLQGGGGGGKWGDPDGVGRPGGCGGGGGEARDGGAGVPGQGFDGGFGMGSATMYGGGGGGIAGAGGNADSTTKVSGVGGLGTNIRWLYGSNVPNVGEIGGGGSGGNSFWHQAHASHGGGKGTASGLSVAAIAAKPNTGGGGGGGVYLAGDPICDGADGLVCIRWIE